MRETVAAILIFLLPAQSQYHLTSPDKRKKVYDIKKNIPTFSSPVLCSDLSTMIPNEEVSPSLSLEPDKLQPVLQT